MYLLPPRSLKFLQESADEERWRETRKRTQPLEKSTCTTGNDLRSPAIYHTPYPIYRIPLRMAGPAVLILVAWLFSWRCHSCCFYLSKLQITRVEPLSVFHIRFIIRCHCRRGSETSIRFTYPTSERIKYIIFVPSLMKGLS